MSSLLKKLVSGMVKNDFMWTLIDRTAIRFARYAEWERRGGDPGVRPPAALFHDAIQTLMPDLTVRNGVFRSMKYTEASAVGSSLFPKLLGSYERELQPILERICTQSYTEIIDVGCAEGYYAVGLARRLPSAKVFAYDIDERARELCGRMARLNGVQDRVVVDSFCSPAVLASFPFTGRALILSDCEGYERELFVEEVVAKLEKHDVLVEIHDFINIDASSTISARFERTHHIEKVESIDDIKKAHTYSYEELRRYDLQARKALLGERRPAIMEWYYMTPRGGLAYA